MGRGEPCGRPSWLIHTSCFITHATMRAQGYEGRAQGSPLRIHTSRVPTDGRVPHHWILFSDSIVKLHQDTGPQATLKTIGFPSIPANSLIQQKHLDSHYILI
jgi:hypothetical protein